MIRLLPLACIMLSGTALAQPQQSVPPGGKLNAAIASKPTPTPATPLTKVTATDATRAQALALAQLLNSEALTSRQLDRLYSVTMPAVLKERPEFQQLEKTYPGISDVAIQAERAYVEPATIANLGAVHQAIANVYTDYLTTADFDTLMTFYGSATGAKALDAAAEGTDLSQMIQRNLTDGPGDVSGSDVQQMTAGSGAKFLGKMDSADHNRLMLFASGPTGRKWLRIQPQVFAAVAVQANKTSSDVMAKASQQVLEAVTAYIQAVDKTATAQKSATEQ